MLRTKQYGLYNCVILYRLSCFRSLSLRDSIEKKNVSTVWHFNKHGHSSVIFACSPIGNKLRIVSDVEKIASLFTSNARGPAVIAL